MGVSESKCVNLYSEAGYLDESYTVIRTSGKQETGWLLTSTVHRCSNLSPHSWRPRAHAYLRKEGWSLSLHNGDQAEEAADAHCCGWRPLGTFWPTRLTGDADAIKAWTEQLRDRLEELAGHQGVPDIWADHQCGRGAPPDYCDACCAQRRAKEKKELLEKLAAADGQEKEELQRALKKIPTAAQHRKWRAWRDVADKLEEAERDGLPMEELKQQADALYSAAFPPQEEP